MERYRISRDFEHKSTHFQVQNTANAGNNPQEKLRNELIRGHLAQKERARV
jgi:hypothetical protein